MHTFFKAKNYSNMIEGTVRIAFFMIPIHLDQLFICGSILTKVSIARRYSHNFIWYKLSSFINTNESDF